MKGSKWDGMVVIKNAKTEMHLYRQISIIQPDCSELRQKKENCIGWNLDWHECGRDLGQESNIVKTNKKSNMQVAAVAT